MKRKLYRHLEKMTHYKQRNKIEDNDKKGAEHL